MKHANGPGSFRLAGSSRIDAVLKLDRKSNEDSGRRATKAVELQKQLAYQWIAGAIYRVVVLHEISPRVSPRRCGKGRFPTGGRMPAPNPPSVPRLVLSALAAGALAGCAGVAARREGPLHVASPDWRDQVVYFVMTDRFDDGDPRNNDQGAGEYDPTDGARWSGGDFAGPARRLDY